MRVRLSLVWKVYEQRRIKLSRGFAFLKKRFRYGANGKVIVTPVGKSKTRQRHRMKAHARMVADGEMTVAQARASYMSWRGGLVKKHGDGKPRLRMDVWHTVRSFDALFEALFGEPYKTTKGQAHEQKRD